MTLTDNEAQRMVEAVTAALALERIRQDRDAGLPVTDATRQILSIDINNARVAIAAMIKAMPAVERAL